MTRFLEDIGFERYRNTAAKNFYWPPIREHRNRTLRTEQEHIWGITFVASKL
ncbi:hypothetical protein SERLA73DRAFT_130406 [Serpula lacrymans var. lacrymans S7.3]|uniref:Uncharacterized protein n=2 Tax=Serpula lacrymans var. lacrymans TaxID=341189 RepID=F8PKE0_SERL3|nr:uncharacterized protein SERLADRAFT_458033 [Serpula lacrymans var. lacrymans S7.9]EGO03854.1 hypothetical protein SERLA73DRAFT_130406 [Serpula lacrymans var. lacrymans S7.3]EGO29779.1 hypothetical protein SERLADRAFT_458033 [Serpula lacrymans var. lacrymans S7.9]